MADEVLTREAEAAGRRGGIALRRDPNAVRPAEAMAGRQPLFAAIRDTPAAPWGTTASRSCRAARPRAPTDSH